MNTIEGLKQQAIRIKRQMKETQNELAALQERQTCIQQCIARLGAGELLSTSDLELIDERDIGRTSPIVLRMKYRGRLAVLSRDIEERTGEVTRLLQAFDELSRCPVCGGTGWTAERTSYERQERLIVAKPGLQRCSTCNGTGRIEL